MNLCNEQTDDAIGEAISLIGRSALDFASGIGGVARARRVRDAWPARDEAAWRQIAEMGWFGMLVPEEQGGLALDARAVIVLGDVLGRTLMPEPVVPAIAGAALLASAGSAGLAAVIDGTRQIALAVARAELDCGLRATVVDATGCQVLVVADEQQQSIRLVDLTAPRVTRVDHECVDGSTLSEVAISRDAWRDAPLLSIDADAFAFAEDVMLLGDAAQLVGAMDAALELAVDYLKTRTQFGVPIGSFQALQHRAASAYVEIAACRSLVGEASRAFVACGESRTRRMAAAAAKARTADAAMRVMDACVQFHGAIGFADEHNVGLYYRRAMVLCARRGNATAQYARYASLAAAHA